MTRLGTLLHIILTITLISAQNIDHDDNKNVTETHDVLNIQLNNNSSVADNVTKAFEYSLSNDYNRALQNDSKLGFYIEKSENEDEKLKSISNNLTFSDDFKHDHITKIIRSSRQPPMKSIDNNTDNKTAKIQRFIDTLHPGKSSLDVMREFGNGENLYFTSRENSSNRLFSIVRVSDIIFLKSAVDNIEDSLCRNQSFRLLRGLVAGKLWAQKMYDASAKSPNGLLWGDTFQLGNFDECLATHSDDNNGKPAVWGQYCLAHILPDHREPHIKTLEFRKRTGPREDIHWAMCVPASCSPRQVKIFTTTLLKMFEKHMTVSIPPTYCQKEAPMILGVKDIIFASCLTVFIIILVTCTIYHGYIHMTSVKKGGKPPVSVVESAILSFSLIKNLKKIFSYKGQNDLGLDAIAGIRTFAMLFILFGHALIFIFSGPVTNTSFYDIMLTKVEHSFLLSGPLLVDTFLLISAFLFCRLLLSELDKRKGHVNVIPIYIFRYIRVTSSYFVIIALYSTWLDKINSGPLWESKISIEKERCLESWWANILYINNYVNTDKLCIFQSWYLAVDTQLFFLAPALIFPLWKSPRVGRWLLVITTVITALIPFFVTYWNDLDPTFLAFPKENADVATNFYFKEAYMKTHMRATAYCIGLLSGYALYVIQKTGYKLSSRTVLISWVACFICLASSVFTVSVFYQEGYVYDPLWAAVFSALHRLGWTVGTGWILIACATKNAGILGCFLSWKPFIPVARLTYCAYLVNGLVEIHSYSTLRNSIHLTVYNMVLLTFSHVFQTFAGALVLCLMFESPIHGFEKILLSTIGKKTGHKKTIKAPEDTETGPNAYPNNNQ